MHAIGYLIISIAKIFNLLIDLYTFIIAGSVIVSWVGADPYNPIVRFLHQATNPVYSRLRRILPAVFFRSAIDFTPLIVLILLMLFQNVGMNLLYELGQSFLIKG